MPQIKAVTENIQWIVIHLSGFMSPVDIVAYKDISEHKVRVISIKMEMSESQHVNKQESKPLFEMKIYRYRNIYLLYSKYLTFYDSVFLIPLAVLPTYTWTNYG